MEAQSIPIPVFLKSKPRCNNSYPSPKDDMEFINKIKKPVKQINDLDNNK